MRWMMVAKFSARDEAESETGRQQADWIRRWFSIVKITWEMDGCWMMRRRHYVWTQKCPSTPTILLLTRSTNVSFLLLSLMDDHQTQLTKTICSAGCLRTGRYSKFNSYYILPYIYLLRKNEEVVVCVREWGLCNLNGCMMLESQVPNAIPFELTIWHSTRSPPVDAQKKKTCFEPTLSLNLSFEGWGMRNEE